MANQMTDEPKELSKVGTRAFNKQVSSAAKPDSAFLNKNNAIRMPVTTVKSFDPEHLAILAGRDLPVDSPEELEEIDTLLAVITRKRKVVANRNSHQGHLPFQDLAVLMKKWGTLVQNIISTRDVLIKYYNREIIEAAQESVLNALQDPKQLEKLDAVDMSKIAKAFSDVIDKAEKQTTFRFHKEESTGQSGGNLENTIFEIFTNDPSAAKDAIAAMKRARGGDNDEK
jgi:hypothetical protein